jgi:hypothetical protein
MGLCNPYLEFYRAMPLVFRRDPSVPPSFVESLSPEWLKLKSAIAGHFAWAVPTEEAVRTIAKYSIPVVEIGAGSGYWAWMMRQAGVAVAAFDADPPVFTWDKVARGDERAIFSCPDHMLLLCWPPWQSDMACNALTCHRGEYFVYVGEWMGGCANLRFFAQLVATFEPVEQVNIPQWYNRDDSLMIFRRRSQAGQDYDVEAMSPTC